LIAIGPAVDAGNEDQVLKDALHREIMGVFARRIAQQRGRRGPQRHGAGAVPSW
jgi:hypothetical protein